MKRFAFFCAAAAAALPSLFAADVPIPAVPSTLNAATVYLDRAVVTRTADLNLAVGTREIAIERLPASLLDQSLQVSGHGTAEATILDVTARQTFVEETPNERVKALEDDIVAVQRQTRSLNDRAAILNEQREFVKRTLAGFATPQPAPSGSSAARPSIEELRGLYAYSDETFGKIATELQSIDTQKEVLAARTTALQQQLNQLRGARGRSYKTVIVRVAAAKAGNLQLNVAYSVPNASWTPTYDARLRSSERAVELSYFGVVRQNTGEDWNNVALTLSTARPSLGGGPPMLPAWVVDEISEERKKQEDIAAATAAQGQYAARGFTVAPSGSNVFSGLTQNSFGGVASRVGNADTYDFGRGTQEQDRMAYASASVDPGATSATFKIAAPASLASNNTDQKVAITTVKLDSLLRYESTPKMREAAFLSAAAANTTEYPFLSGTMNTFLDDGFVATSAMKTVMPGETLVLQLGADDGISIKRKLVNRFNEDTGLTSKGRRVTYEFLITVTNHKKTPEQVLFKEAVPVSRNEKIVVRQITPLEKDIGAPDKLKDITRETDGRITWRLSLKPGEKREVPLKFSIDFPTDISISGLE